MSGRQVIPGQKLEDKIGYVAVIESVSPQDKRKSSSKEVQLGIQNRTDTLHGYSSLTLNKKDLQRLLDCYDVGRPEYLVGKPVLSVYTRNNGVILCGLIPINLDRDR